MESMDINTGTCEGTLNCETVEENNFYLYTIAGLATTVAVAAAYTAYKCSQPAQLSTLERLIASGAVPAAQMAANRD